MPYLAMIGENGSYRSPQTLENLVKLPFYGFAAVLYSWLTIFTDEFDIV